MKHDTKQFICKVLLAGFVITSVWFTTPAFSDQLIIPLSCWPIEIQQSFAKEGKKLDLSASERTKDSWGFIVSKGSSFELYTYKSATKEDFDLIQKIVFEIDGRE